MANHEGYTDNTADRAIARVMRKPTNADTPEEVSFMVKTFKQMASVLGYEIKGRISFVDRKTGKEWK